MTLFRVTEESRYQLFFNLFHPHFPLVFLALCFYSTHAFSFDTRRTCCSSSSHEEKKGHINIMYTSPRFRTEDKKEQHEHCLSPLTLSRRWVDWRLHILNWGVLMLFLDAFWLVSWKAQDRKKKKKTKKPDVTFCMDKCDDWIWTPKLIDWPFRYSVLHLLII